MRLSADSRQISTGLYTVVDQVLDNVVVQNSSMTAIYGRIRLTGYRFDPLQSLLLPEKVVAPIVG